MGWENRKVYRLIVRLSLHTAVKIRKKQCRGNAESGIRMTKSDSFQKAVRNRCNSRMA
jgi:hypothetical protein